MTKNNQNVLQINYSTEYQSYRANEFKDITLICSISACSMPTNKNLNHLFSRHIPIDMIVVLDNSTSMKGKKMELCINTIEFLSKQLNPMDRMALITFSVTSERRFPLTYMDEYGKFILKETLKDMSFGMATNIYAGLVAGINEITYNKSSNEQNKIQALLFLTDGESNVKYLYTNDIIMYTDIHIKECQGEEPNFSIFAFGYGTSHNDHLLRKVAKLGDENGMYYSITNENHVQYAFADCLGGLFSIIAQNIKIRFKTAGKDVKIIQIDKDRIESNNQNEIYWKLGNIYAEEKKNVLLNIMIPPILIENNNYPVVSFEVYYYNLLDKCNEISNEIYLYVNRTNNNTILMNQIPDNITRIQQFRLLAIKTIEDSNTNAKQGKIGQSAIDLEHTINEIENQVKTLSLEKNEKSMVDNISNDLKRCRLSINDTNTFLKSGKYMMSTLAESHSRQRSNISNPFHKNPYATTNKLSMINQFIHENKEDKE